jgi:hypothetical protein
VLRQGRRPIGLVHAQLDLVRTLPSGHTLIHLPACAAERALASR